MTPIKFPGSNIVFGAGQEEYNQLPAMKLSDGQVITCWKLSPEEIEQVSVSGKIYLKQLTFNNPLQPLLPIVDLADAFEITND